MEGHRVSPPPMQKPNSPAETLAHGQKVEGKITKITEFGAFVDVGAGRDGMIHISELQAGRVQKVSDVVNEGQAVTVWVKEVDAKRNRISLTMVDPKRKSIRDLVPGITVEGTVTRLAPYGAFIDIGAERDGMLHVKEMGDGYIEDPSKIVKVGQTVTVRVLSVETQRQRVDLTMKPAAEPSAQKPEEAVMPPEVEDDIPTIMETAMRRAMDRRDRRDRKERKRKERQAFREEQEDILIRTLERHQQDR